MVIILKTFGKIHFQLVGSHVAKDRPILANPKEEEAQEIKPRTLNLKSASGETLLSDFGGRMLESESEAKDDLNGINGCAEAVPSPEMQPQGTLKSDNSPIIGRVTSLLCTRSFW